MVWIGIPSTESLKYQVLGRRKQEAGSRGRSWGNGGTLAGVSL